MNTKLKRRIHKGKKKMWNLTESDARATSKRSQTSILFSSLSLFNYFLFNILGQEEGKKPFLEFIMHGLIFLLSRNEIFEFYGSQRRLETKFFLFASPKVVKAQLREPIA